MTWIMISICHRVWYIIQAAFILFLTSDVFIDSNIAKDSFNPTFNVMAGHWDKLVILGTRTLFMTHIEQIFTVTLKIVLVSFISLGLIGIVIYKRGSSELPTQTWAHLWFGFKTFNCLKATSYHSSGCHGEIRENSFLFIFNHRMLRWCVWKFVTLS